MSKIRSAFENGKAFIPFITCGDPNLETTAKIVREAVANGADLIELGIPFSDPTAEGPVIQGANIKALAAGVTTDKVFDLVRELRKDVTIPMVFMTYANVVYSYGAEKFISTCKEIGIDGLILPDIPYEEKEEFLPLCEKYDVDLISFIAPTSKDRIAMIAKEATGFIYVISSLGVTGTRSEIKTDLASIVKVIRENTDVPCAIGFVISCVGDNRDYSFVKTRYGNTLTDKVLENTLKYLVPSHKAYSFFYRGSDERQFNAPGVDLPVCSVSRTKYGSYPEYHTSKDDLTLISPEGFTGAYEVMTKCLDVLENNFKYKIKVLCEPQLGKRGMYPTVSQKGSYKTIFALRDFIAYADGTNDLLDISEIIGVPAYNLIEIKDKLLQNKLLDIVNK